jgi:hypothetical protein
MRIVSGLIGLCLQVHHQEASVLVAILLIQFSAACHLVLMLMLVRRVVVSSFLSM